MKQNIIPYDTTLRDGAQTPGVTLSVESKLRIAQELDKAGFAFIEGGWPGANITDREFFIKAKKLKFKNAKLVAFGMTSRVGIKAKDDIGLQELIKSKTEIVTIFGKSWILHVRDVLRTTSSNNLELIYDSVDFLSKNGREVFYDAEHFFDGYQANKTYALKTLESANAAGAKTIVLCDTNGGSTPEFIYKAVLDVKKSLGGVRFGIHVHNDGGLAIVNTLAAIKAGVILVQGTINGLGERTGNLDFCTFLPTAQFKYGLKSGLDLEKINELSNFVELESGFAVPQNTPYVGTSAFTHKGGVHVSAARRNSKAYEHINPLLVGAQRRFEHSDQGGSANVEAIAEKFGYQIERESHLFSELIEKTKEIKVFGDAQEFLLLEKVLEKKGDPFEILPETKVVISRKKPPLAKVKVKVGKTIHNEQAVGKGGLHAFDLALKKVLSKIYPEVNQIRLTGYRAILPNSEIGTEAEVEVHIEFSAKGTKWTSRSRGTEEHLVNQNAVVDGYKYYILRNNSLKKEDF